MINGNGDGGNGGNGDGGNGGNGDGGNGGNADDAGSTDDAATTIESVVVVEGDSDAGLDSAVVVIYQDGSADVANETTGEEYSVDNTADLPGADSTEQ